MGTQHPSLLRLFLYPLFYLLLTAGGHSRAHCLLAAVRDWLTCAREDGSLPDPSHAWVLTRLPVARFLGGIHCWLTWLVVSSEPRVFFSSLFTLPPLPSLGYVAWEWSHYQRIYYLVDPSQGASSIARSTVSRGQGSHLLWPLPFSYQLEHCCSRSSEIHSVCFWLSTTPWTIQSMEFSRPEYSSGWLLPFPGDLPNPGIESRSPTLQVDSLPAEGSPRILEWVASPLSSGSSWPRNQIGVSCIAGRFFTSWWVPSFQYPGSPRYLVE